MCELFGISTKTTYPANEFLHSFFTHSEEHHSGWGIAQFHNGYASILICYYNPMMRTNLKP